MTAVRAAGELRPDNAHVAALVLLSGSWLLGSLLRGPAFGVDPCRHRIRIGGEAATEMGLCSRHP